MGSKQSKPPSDYEIGALSKQTGLDEYTIKGLFTEFQTNSKNGFMNKKQFLSVYSNLTPGEDPTSSRKLKKLSNRVFKAFDKDKSNSLSFDEFVAAYYMLKTQGMARQKMEFLLNQLISTTPGGQQPREISNNTVIDDTQISQILNGVDAGLGLKRSDDAMKRMTQNMNGQPLTIQSFVKSVIEDPIYEKALNQPSEQFIMETISNDSSDSN